MKKFLLLTLVVLTGIVSSCKYDDDELWDNVNDLANRLTTLETATKQLNSDIAAMQSIVTALQNQVTVSDVETLTDGYIIHFSDGTKATIKNGADGEDGMNAPIINVAKENGEYYWTITIDEKTEWLTDEAGNKLPVSGKDGSNGAAGADGRTPVLGVDAQGYWTVDGNRIKDANGNAVKAEGENGDSKFESIVEDEGVVVITLTDGTQYELAMAASVTYKDAQGNEVSADDISIKTNSSVTLTYDVPQLGSNYSVEVLKAEGVSVSVGSNKQLTFTPSSSMIDAKAVIIYFNANQTITSVLTFKEAWIDETKNVRMNSTYYETIQAAVNEAQSDDIIEIASGEYNEVVKVTGGKNITLEAMDANVVIAGLDHQSNANPSTVIVKGITFDNSLASTGWFTGTAQNIAPCVGAWGGYFTFEDCKFIVAGTSGKETGVMTWWTGDNLMSLSFDNCAFEGKNDHANARAMQIYGNVNMEVNDCTFNTYKDYTLKYVANEGNVATFNNNIVNNSENFVELGSVTYPGSKYTVKINKTTLGEGVTPYVIANNEEQTVIVDGKQYIADGVIYDTTTGIYEVSSATGLQTVLDKAEAGQTTIMLMNEITGDVTVTQKENVGIIIDGNKNTYNGVIIIDGKSARYETTYQSIQNVNFSAESISTDAYINLGKGGDNDTRYTNHVTIKDCTFSYSGEDEGPVAIKSYTGGDKNLTVNGCIVNKGMHSMLQVTNVEEGLKITGCKVYSKNGINLNNTPALTMSSCTFDVTGYAVRFGVSGSTINNGVFNISSSTLKSECNDGDAVIIFRGTMTGSTLTLTNTTVTGSTQFTNDSDATVTIE